MNRLIAIATVALMMLAAPASDAGDACGVLYDPVSDVHPMWMPVSTGLGPRADAIDLTGVQMMSSADALVVIIGVRDIGAVFGPGVEGATYTVDWEAGKRHVYARAVRSSDGWTYDWFDSDRGSGAATGSISGNTIAIDVPLPVATEGSNGVLERVHAWSVGEATDARAPASMDEAPNLSGGPRRFQLGAGCAAPASGMGSSCTVLSADPTTPAGPTNRSTDLRSVAFAAGDDSMVAEIGVADLAAAPAGSAERWDVTWFNPRLYEGDERQTAFAERFGERVEFGFARGGDHASTIGSLDLASNTIRIVIPREHLELLEGTRIKDVRASAVVSSGSVGTGTWLPRTSEGGSWVIGRSCSALEMQICPIVLDRKGDARYAEATDEVPENYAGLDLRSVGASPSGDRVTLTARVENLRAPDPPGADVVGWTISWLDGERRIYAQAERYPEGLVFRYGARKAGGDAPAGPTFAGIATTGMVDVANNVVSIDVPRGLMPGDGTELGGVGATAWGLAGRNSAAVYLVWDETVARSYLTGVTCAS